MSDEYEEYSEDAVFITPLARKYEIYLNGEIKSPGYYSKIIDMIRNASELDLIVFRINSVGGDSATAIQFRAAISQSSAHTVGCVEGNCLSAATMILLACDQIEIMSNSTLMIHNYSAVFSTGKGGELYDQISFTRKWSEDFLKSVYSGFLDESEIQNVLDGKDYWYDDVEFSKKLENFFKMREKKEEESDMKDIEVTKMHESEKNWEKLYE